MASFKDKLTDILIRLTTEIYDDVTYTPDMFEGAVLLIWFIYLVQTSGVSELLLDLPSGPGGDIGFLLVMLATLPSLLIVRGIRVTPSVLRRTGTAIREIFSTNTLSDRQLQNNFSSLVVRQPTSSILQPVPITVSSCAYCFNPLDGGVSTPFICGHSFHNRCLRFRDPNAEYIQRNCPICGETRRNISSQNSSSSSRNQFQFFGSSEKSLDMFVIADDLDSLADSLEKTKINVRDEKRLIALLILVFSKMINNISTEYKKSPRKIKQIIERIRS